MAEEWLTGPVVVIGGSGQVGVRIRHLSPGLARLLTRLMPSLPAPLVDVLLRDCVPTGDPAETAARFGFRLLDLSQVWN